MLFADSREWDRDRLRTFLKLHFKRALLTRLENDHLKAAGLNDRMPEDRDAAGNPYERYAVAGIKGAETSLERQPRH